MKCRKTKPQALILAIASSEHKLYPMLMLQSKFTAPLLFIVILGIATLGGCGTVPDKKPEQITAAKVEPTSAESMVSQAQLSSDPERSRLLLKAALQLDKEGQKPEALALLDQIRFSALTVAQQEQLVLLGARLSVEQGRGKDRAIEGQIQGP